MKCREILTVLITYRDRIIELLELNHQEDTIITTASEYSFITITITQNNNPSIIMRFELTDNSAKIESIYSDDKTIETRTKTKVGSTTWPGFKTITSVQVPLPNNIIEQLESADNIASLVVNCATGDDYRPGNFSKIILAGKHIELQQINYMNAKSLDHKNDYSLRSLVFRIALIGDSKMITEFADRSSVNNRQCGERIKAALDWSPH
jgi:hypothetical protein